MLSPDTDDMVFTGLTADVARPRQPVPAPVDGVRPADVGARLGAWSRRPGARSTTLPRLPGRRASPCRDRLGLPFQEVLSFWMPLETRDVTNHLGDEDTVTPSTYSEVFRNPAVLASAGGMFVPLNQSDDHRAPSDASPIVITTAEPHGYQDRTAGDHRRSARQHRRRTAPSRSP